MLHGLRYKVLSGWMDGWMHGSNLPHYSSTDYCRSDEDTYFPV